MVQSEASPRSIRRAAEQRAAQRVRLLLGTAGGTNRGTNDSTGGGGSGADLSGAQESLLVHQQLQGEVEAVRERCKRERILEHLKVQVQQGQVVLVPAEGAAEGAEEAAGARQQAGGGPVRQLWLDREGQQQGLERMHEQQHQRQCRGPVCPRPLSPPPPAAPAVHRQVVVVLPAGCPSVSKKVRYTNCQPRAVRLGLHSDSPQLVRLGGQRQQRRHGQQQVPGQEQEPVLELGPGESGAIRMTFEAAGLAGSAERTALVYVGSGAGGTEGTIAADCFRVTVRRG